MTGPGVGTVRHHGGQYVTMIRPRGAFASVLEMTQPPEPERYAEAMGKGPESKVVVFRDLAPGFSSSFPEKPVGYYYHWRSRVLRS
jgi:hypothetical protein